MAPRVMTLRQNTHKHATPARASGSCTSRPAPASACRTKPSSSPPRRYKSTAVDLHLSRSMMCDMLTSSASISVASPARSKCKPESAASAPVTSKAIRCSPLRARDSDTVNIAPRFGRPFCRYQSDSRHTGHAGPRVATTVIFTESVCVWSRRSGRRRWRPWPTEPRDLQPAPCRCCGARTRSPRRCGCCNHSARTPA